jgi:hypothetical protein
VLGEVLLSSAKCFLAVTLVSMKCPFPVLQPLPSTFRLSSSFCAFFSSKDLQGTPLFFLVRSLNIPTPMRDHGFPSTIRLVFA